MTWDHKEYHPAKHHTWDYCKFYQGYSLGDWDLATKFHKTKYLLEEFFTFETQSKDENYIAYSQCRSIRLKCSPCTTEIDFYGMFNLLHGERCHELYLRIYEKLFLLCPVTEELDGVIQRNFVNKDGTLDKEAILDLYEGETELKQTLTVCRFDIKKDYPESYIGENFPIPPFPTVSTERPTVYNTVSKEVNVLLKELQGDLVFNLGAHSVIRYENEVECTGYVFLSNERKLTVYQKDIQAEGLDPLKLSLFKKLYGDVPVTRVELKMIGRSLVAAKDAFLNYVKKGIRITESELILELLNSWRINNWVRIRGRSKHPKKWKLAPGFKDFAYPCGNNKSYKREVLEKPIEYNKDAWQRGISMVVNQELLKLSVLTNNDLNDLSPQEYANLMAQSLLDNPKTYELIQKAIETKKAIMKTARASRDESRVPDLWDEELAEDDGEELRSAPRLGGEYPPNTQYPSPRREPENYELFKPPD